MQQNFESVPVFHHPAVSLTYFKRALPTATGWRHAPSRPIPSLAPRNLLVPERVARVCDTFQVGFLSRLLPNQTHISFFLSSFYSVQQVEMAPTATMISQDNFLTGSYPSPSWYQYLTLEPSNQETYHHHHQVCRTEYVRKVFYLFVFCLLIDKDAFAHMEPFPNSTVPVQPLHGPGPHTGTGGTISRFEFNGAAANEEATTHLSLSFVLPKGPLHQGLSAGERFFENCHRSRHPDCRCIFKSVRRK